MVPSDVRPEASPYHKPTAFLSADAKDPRTQGQCDKIVHIKFCFVHRV